MSREAAEHALAEAPAARGRALLSVPEGQWFDRKSVRVSAATLADSLLAFANAEGGTLVIGLRDGHVEGVDGAGARLADWQQAALDFTLPTVRCRSRLVDCLDDRSEPNHLLVVEIALSDTVHANRKDDVYLRVGDENRRLSIAQRQELVYDKGQATYESIVIGDARWADLDQRDLRVYADALGHPQPKRLLSARGLLDRSGTPTVGALLLFAPSPQAWLPEASVRVLRYRGIQRGSGSRQQLVHDSRIEGPLPQQIAHARQEVLRWIPARRALAPSGRFDQVGIIPEDAWLEALVNAVIHRSYSSSGDHIRVEIFDDRIEIESPGRFPGIAEGQEPQRVTRFARNPRIARVCSDLHLGQELGEGIRRMFEEMHIAGLIDPAYRQTAGSVRVTLAATPVDRALEDRLPPGARDVVAILREAGRASTGDIIEALRLSRPVVIRRLKALEEEGIVRWVGQSPKDPRAYWTL